MKPRAILTFDLEFWYNSEFLKKYLPKNLNVLPDYVKESTERILDILDKYNQKATFFVLGQLAEKYPSIIKKVFNCGHEIAFHGYSHKVLKDITKKEFEKELIWGKKIIKDITGKNPKGFRAPAFSLNNNTKWALEILKKYDFQYDSSIHPFSFKKINGPILEIPPSLGGIYFRGLPLNIYIFLIKHLPKKPVLYFHPYELFDFMPKIQSCPWLKRKIKYVGTKNAFKKFEKLVQYFQFSSIENIL